MIEKRFVKGAEVRAQDDGHISGYAAVFNQEYVMCDFPTYRVVETIAPGAFKRALTESQDVRALFNHDANNLLGRTTAGTLTLSEDQHGLHFDCSPPDTQLGKDVRTLIKRRDISGCSFAFTVTKQNRVEENTDGKTIIRREIQDMDLYDVGPVTYPAYEGTDVKSSRASAELRGLFPQGLPEELKAQMPTDKLRIQMASATDPDNDGDNDTNPATDPDNDGDLHDRCMGTMSDHFQRSAEHCDNMSDEHDEMAAKLADHSAYVRSLHKQLPSDHPMKEYSRRSADMYDQQSNWHQDMSDAEGDRAQHFREMCAAVDGSVARTTAKPIEQRDRVTKRVAGEDLPASAFLYVGDPQKNSTWALPWKFSTKAKTISHLRNALARFSQTQKIPADKKPGVWRKLVAKCKANGIKVSDEQKSVWEWTEEMRSEWDYRQEGAHECECECASCQEGDCEDCTDNDCDDPNCDHGSEEKSITVLPADVSLTDEERSRLFARIAEVSN